MKNITPTLLSAAETLFCDKVLEGMGHAKAAIAAGYSPKSARTTAARLLRKAAVADYIAARQQNRAAKTETRRDRILQELETLAFARIENLIRIDENGIPQVDFSRATPDQLAAVTSVQSKRRTVYTPKGEVLGVEEQAKFNMADKYRGLELLGRAEGLFATDKVEVVVDVADRLLAARQRLAKLEGPGDED
jgi:phage terminase small subunit